MKISAVVATYNRRDSLADCLATLFEQDFPANQYEIIVVVDGSSDGTTEILISLQPPGKLVVIEQQNRGQAAARNAGVNASSAEIVLFLDDDLLCDSKLLSAHVTAHKQGMPTLVFGRMRAISAQSPCSAERWVYASLERYYERLEKDPRPKWPDDAWVGPNSSVSRAVFLEAGGYDEKLRRGEDVDLGLRLWKMGVKFQFNPQAITSHRWVKSNSQMRVDDEADGASMIRLCHKHPEYRSHSGLSGFMSSPAWKRLAVRAAATYPAVVGMLLGVLMLLLEKFAKNKWAQRCGMRLFLVRQGVAMLAGARREAGSWQVLTKLFGHRLAVLLYHHVGFPSTETHLSLTVSPANFLRHVRWLRWRGYTAITPAQWLSWCSAGEFLPEKPVLFTFDDAYEDITKHALPVLEQYGFRGAVFVISGKVGGLTSWEGLPLMTMKQIRHWATRGVEIGAHTRTHPDLTAVPDEAGADEIVGSKEDLTKAGLTPLSFAYPYGCFDERIRASVSGVFPLAFTCEEGLNDLGTDHLLLKRTMVQPGDTLLDIEFRAAFGKSPGSGPFASSPAIAVREGSSTRWTFSSLMPAAILHLLGTAELEGTGIARIVAALVSRLDPAKYDVHAWFLGPSPSGPLVEDLRDAGATVRSIDWWRGARDPAGAYRFWCCLRNYDFAVVHQHFGARSIRWLISLSSHARLVVHLHGRISEPSSSYSVPVEVRGAKVVIAASRAVALQIPALEPIVVHPGLESLKEFHPKNKASRTTIVIGAACRLVALKGLVDLIRAMAFLHLEFPTLRLEIAGVGPLREHLEREASCLSLTGKVRFLGWQRDLGPILRSWDIFAMPSLEEGFGMAALEAMAEGLPVVATSVGGLPEVIADCQTGYLVPPSDVAALTRRLRLLILDPELRRTMGAAGRERVRDHFSVDRMVAEVASIYNSLIP